MYACKKEFTVSSPKTLGITRHILLPFQAMSGSLNKCPCLLTAFMFYSITTHHKTSMITVDVRAYFMFELKCHTFIVTLASLNTGLRCIPILKDISVDDDGFAKPMCFYTFVTSVAETVGLNLRTQHSYKIALSKVCLLYNTFWSVKIVLKCVLEMNFFYWFFLESNCTLVGLHQAWAMWPWDALQK